MNKIVGVQFRNHGKVYNFDSGHFVLKKGDKVMVITEEGPAIGRVCTEPQKSAENITKPPLKKVFRLAVREEIERFERICSIEEDVFIYCYEKVRERSLPMYLVSVESRFDGTKIMVHFTAEGRVDFRELVKDLVRKFQTRIEMKQIGIRQQAKIVGGIGSCGRSLCCSSFLNIFAPVTIKMAKEQNISLNPNKMSGMCGRLMCCLAYEHEYYVKIKKNLPKIGKKVTTEYGEGKVIRQNILKENLTVMLESGDEIEVQAKDLYQSSGSWSLRLRGRVSSRKNQKKE
jgi:cell fate regulator YaaT (PSP1 superfamily)